VSWINAQDAAELAAVALLHPERFADATIHYPPGTEEISHHEIASILSEELGVPVRFEPASEATWSKELAARAEANPHGPVNADMAGHIAAVGRVIAQQGMARKAAASYFQHITGREPITVKNFVRTHKEEFER
jgi:uncharacterized protein YbjT (DUF2867 family)